MILPLGLPFQRWVFVLVLKVVALMQDREQVVLVADEGHTKAHKRTRRHTLKKTMVDLGWGKEAAKVNCLGFFQ